MTVQEVEKAGMSDIDIALGIVTGELEDESGPVEYRDPVHGRIVKTRFDPYHDVKVYEDGYEERYYIGDQEENHGKNSKNHY